MINRGAPVATPRFLLAEVRRALAVPFVDPVRVHNRDVSRAAARAIERDLWRAAKGRDRAGS